MTERAIDKIIEELENQAKQAKQDMADARQYGVNSAGFNGYIGRMEMAEQMLEEARRLAAEEAKEKPTAPASLVGRLGELVALAKDSGVDEHGNYWIMGSVVESVLSLYRPSTQADIVLWEGEAKVGQPDFMVIKGREDNESVCLVAVPYRLIKGQKGQILFRKYEGAK